MTTSAVDKSDDANKTNRRPGTKSDAQTVEVVNVTTADAKGSSAELVVANSAAHKGAIHLVQPSKALPNNRPISAGIQKVSEIFHSAGERPVMTSTFKFSEVFNVAGERPIMSGTLNIDEIYSSMGANRPVASNTIDNSVSLMGFLD
jgi:hypothetical protein